MTDFAALEAAAAGLRRLNRAVAGFHATDNELLDLAWTATALAQRLEGGRPRSKGDDMTRAFGTRSADDPPPAPEIGGSLEFDPFGAGGGRLHPSSVDIRFVRDTETSVIATANVDGMFQGPPDRVHGGIVALLFDELMGAVNRISGRRAFTARLIVNLRAAAPVDTELTWRAWVDGIDGRKITIRAEGRSAQGLFADAEGLFIAFDPII